MAGSGGRSSHEARRKLRVLVLTSTFPRWPDDTEPRFVLDLCRHLCRYAEIRVIAPHTQGAQRQETIEGVPVRRFRYFIPRLEAVAYDGGILPRLKARPWRAVQLPCFLVSLLLAVRRQIREWQPDVVHAHWIIPQGLIAAAGVPKRIPVLCTGHGTDVHGLQGFPLGALKRQALQRCRAVTVVSEAMAGPVRELAPGVRTEVIPMGTDLRTLFTPPNDPGTRGDDEIAFVGRLVDGKGLPVLLEAFAALCSDRPRVKLTIVGDGPLRGDLEEQVQDAGLGGRVVFTGAMPQRRLADCYRRAALTVLPSLREGFGLVLSEAMGCGCPVVASDIPAVRQIVEPGVTGILVAPGDVPALEHAMRRLLDDQPLRDRLALAALDAVRRRFDWPVVASRYWQLIEQLTGEPGDAH